MNHLKWMGHAMTVFDIHRHLRDDLESCEITLSAKGHSVRAHRYVLSSCSDLLRALLADVPLGQEATIVVPDINGALLDSVLGFIYLGETNLTSTNLSEFLEAINILGIKSAISFECNTAALSSAPANFPTKTIAGLQIGQEVLLEADNYATEKIAEPAVLSAEPQPSTSRGLEFLDVYNDAPHKITYSIEHMPVATTTTGNEFILTESAAGTFTFTQAQNSKLDSGSCTDVDTDDAQIIDDFESGNETIIDMTDGNVVNNTTDAPPPPSNVLPVLQMKPKSKPTKMKTSSSPEPINDDADEVMAMKTEIKPIVKVTEGYQNALDHSLELAVSAVIDEGMSLQKAAAKYDLSKTVLWRRVRKNPNYMKTTRENPVLSMAYERLKVGESLKSISRDLDIPMSTLHRHKVRLASQGRLPEHVTFRKRDSESKNQLKLKLSKAVHACVHEGMSQNYAANLFDIPKSTLWRHLQKRVAEAELAQKMENEGIKEEVILSHRVPPSFGMNANVNEEEMQKS